MESDTTIDRLLKLLQAQSAVEQRFETAILQRVTEAYGKFAEARRELIVALSPILASQAQPAGQPQAASASPVQQAPAQPQLTAQDRLAASEREVHAEYEAARAEAQAWTAYELMMRAGSVSS